MFPIDQFDPYNKTAHQGFLKAFGDMWRPWLGEEAYQSFIKSGYYTKLHPNSNLRIIGLNSFLCDTFNINLIRDSTDVMGTVSRDIFFNLIINNLTPLDYLFGEFSKTSREGQRSRIHSRTHSSWRFLFPF